MLKDYVCKTLSQYCFPGCETLVGKTRNHLTQTPHSGVPPHSETIRKPLLSCLIATTTSYIYYEDRLVEAQIRINNLDI